jgi:hypothetical protein
MSSTDVLEWYSMGDFIHFHSILPHYHIHPDQVQDQPTTQVDLFLTFYKIITRKFLFYYFIHTL